MDYIPSNTIRMPGDFFDTIAAEPEETRVPLPLATVLLSVDAMTEELEGIFRFDLYYDYILPLRASREVR